MWRFGDLVRAHKTDVFETTGPKLMTDTQHSTLNTQCIWLGIPERRMWILPHFKIPHSNTWIWCWSLKCRVLINRQKFRVWTQNLWWILRTLHSGFTLHTQNSPIQIHWVWSVECWVSVISLGPGAFTLQVLARARPDGVFTQGTVFLKSLFWFVTVLNQFLSRPQLSDTSSPKVIELWSLHRSTDSWLVGCV